ncbi:hypothetical protein [Bacillus sp. B15-48]|uniref:hypothetical protein n=1 Tax=Bacillus sp. B15-48 TaxID=1548601 RepID=UPI00193ED683|nr:hypothetical protein [Bacillus sp. B15-48]MBM4762284.1 hypothetical protein [Bacillus sp. B15-48]
MYTVYGVEANSLASSIPEFHQMLTSSLEVFENHESMYIYKNSTVANEAKNLLIEANLFEEVHPLLMANKGTEGECFFDYGFNGEKWTYLYKDCISAFTLFGDDLNQSKMAKLQINEHLIYSLCTDSQEIFFIDNQLEPLIKGIASAYKCETNFLDLDKWKKNL